MRHPKYPVTDLVVGAAFVGNMNEFLTYLGEEITPSRRREMWARLSNLGVDVSHWSRSPRGSYSLEDLGRAVAASDSYAEVMRRLGIKPAGGSHFHISKRIRAAGIDTSHFTRTRNRRNKPARRKTAEAILTVRPPGSYREKRELLARAMLESGTPYLCQVCGCNGTWRGNPLTLAIDHVNGDVLDNRLENLRFLCPNCHAQTATWCRRKLPKA